jgi:arylsulfatase A-like enzyme
VGTIVQEKKTNIIFILSDDHGAWAMGCSGNQEIRTPHLDRLASRGTRYDHFFCVSPVCSPARASLLTGKIPSQHGVMDWIIGGNGILVDPRRGDTGQAIEYLKNSRGYTDVLAEHGYSCGIIGKWHLGNARNPQKSFSRWKVIAGGASTYNNAKMFEENGEMIEASGYLTEFITDQAIQYIKEQQSADQPFYISVHYTAPHAPWKNNHPKRYTDMYADCLFLSCPQGQEHPWSHGGERNDRENAREDLIGYFAAVTAMDENIGKLMDTVDEMGISENTLICYVSDNGFNCGHHGIWGKGNGTLPNNMYDTSIKVPAIFSQPGTIPQGRVSSALVSGYDVFPTLLEYIGIPNSETNLPGASFVRDLLGHEEESREHVVVYDEYGPVRMIRNKEWKYVHRYPDGPNELYNLSQDPGEVRNLYGTDEAMSGKLLLELEQWFRTYVNVELNGAQQPVTGRGQIRMVGEGGEGEPSFSKYELTHERW